MTKTLLSPQERFSKIRRFIYLFVIVGGLFHIFFPLVASADIFNNDVQDVYVEITENVKETNDILSQAFQFCQVSPYDIVDKISTITSNATIATAIHSASKTIALVVATLLLMVDFFRKTVNFEWASKWENILIFLVKIILIKQVVQNADVIIGYLYSGFNYINQQATGASPEFLPYGTETEYTIQIKETLFSSIQDNGFKAGWLNFWEDVGASSLNKNFTYIISQDAVKIFYPYATFPSNAAPIDFESHAFVNPTGSITFNATLEIVWLQVYFIVMKAIAYIIFVIAIGRVFELTVYTLFAPLPIATLASDITHDVAKNFIKNYIATVIQVAVIVLMFIVYSAVNEYFRSPEWAYMTHRTLLSFITLISLGLGVIKSGSWAKRICGIG